MKPGHPVKPGTKLQFSSGGVIFRGLEGKVEIALISTKGGSVWTLPKGMADKAEKPEEAALREVREETGLTGKLIGKIGDIKYWYFLKEETRRVHKTVSYYLIEYTAGNTEDHDFEVDEARWVPIEKAAGMAAYDGDREIIGKASEMIGELKRGSRG